MTRVLSGAVLLAIAVAAVWLAPPALFLLVAVVLALLAVREVLAIAHAGGLAVPAATASIAAALTAATFSSAVDGAGSAPTLDVVLLGAVVALGCAALVAWRGGHDALPRAAVALFPSLYIGLPIGAMIAIRETYGREALFLLMLTVVVSDTAQYYTGRTLGRTKLAPAVSPKKTVEGAGGGFVFGALFLAVAGAWWLPQIAPAGRAALGAVLVAVGIAGDLFESMLKRSVDVKDSSALIPGHGGVLDRIDALLFAAPIYYVVLKYA
jgi:phosphatidate cytidylyltransferase